MARNNRNRRDKVSRRSLPVTTRVMTKPISVFDWRNPLRRKTNYWSPSVTVKKTLPTVKRSRFTREVRNQQVPRRFQDVARAISGTTPWRTNNEQLNQQTRDVCADRRSRKEVMFAINKAGRSGQRTPRFTAKSKIICRR